MPRAVHRKFFLDGPAGRLEALLWPVTGPAAVAAVVCHPHPLYGGTLHNKVVYQTAKTLRRFGLPVLRFNFRGTGESEGAHDKGHGEQGDVAAALDRLAAEYPGVPLLVAGFSFGAWVGLRTGCADPRVTELIGLGLPVGEAPGRSLSYLDSCAKWKILVSGALDRYAPAATLTALVESLSPPARQNTRLVLVSGADHFFTGRLEEVDEILSAWLTERHPELAAQFE